MYKELCVKRDLSLRHAMECLVKTGFGTLFITDSRGKMEGILTDGDVRKAMLRGASLDDRISGMMNRHFMYARPSEARQDIVRRLRQMGRRQMPVLDAQKRLVDAVLIDGMGFYQEDTTVVIMAGGLGTRIGAPEKGIPKPMFKVGSRPILETIVEELKQCGFANFVFSVNFRSEVIQDHFGDGSRWGVRIRYLKEPKRMGTAGSLSLLRPKPKGPFIVMNADVLTKVDFRSFMDFHIEHGCAATMAVKQYDFEIPFGIVEHNGHRVTRLVEKPEHSFYVNAGMYILEPECLARIPKASSMDMTDLMNTLIRKHQSVLVFPIREYWTDVGRHGDLEKAGNEFDAIWKGIPTDECERNKSKKSNAKRRKNGRTKH